jgi:flagella basal body P-ring formation protein FlgA
MKKRLLQFVFSSVALPAISFAGCLPVEGNRILGRDLARADERFSALPADLTVGFAPSPGTSRIYPAAELQRIARARGILLADPQEVCFELTMMRLNEDNVAAAILRALPAELKVKSDDLKIVELSKTPLPAGDIEFPIEGLEPVGPTAAGIQLWRGYVKYADTRRAVCWARVALNTHYTVVVAEKDLPVNSPVNPASLRVENRTGPFQRSKTATRIEEVGGRVPDRAVRAGETIPLAILSVPPQVRRGDAVTVDVQSGLAHLQFDAVAESSANEGDVIELRNPSSGKTFRAKLNSGSRAVVVVAGARKS